MPRRHKGITYSGQHPTHPTSGLKGYPAVDIDAKPGTPFLAPENGTIIRVSGRDPRKGATSPHGAFGWSVYFRGQSGTIYFITHLGSARGKGRYSAGSVIGVVGNFPGSTPDHAHVGIHVGPNGLPDYTAIRSQERFYGDNGLPPSPDTGYDLGAAQTGAQGLTGASGYQGPPPEYPLGPELPGAVTQPPGAIPPDQGFAELSPNDYWRTLAELPFSSPETQQWAARMNRHASR